MLTPDQQRSRDLFNEVWAACADHTLANANGTDDPAKLFEVMRQKFTTFADHERAVEREACATAASTLERADLDLAPHETYADGRRAAAAKIRARSNAT